MRCKDIGIYLVQVLSTNNSKAFSPEKGNIMSVGAKRNVSASDVQLDRSTIIGRGRSAIIFAGTFGNIQVAIKRVMSTDLHPQWENQPVDACFNKITALQHPNVLKITGIYDDEHFR